MPRIVFQAKDYIAQLHRRWSSSRRQAFKSLRDAIVSDVAEALVHGVKLPEQIMKRFRQPVMGHGGRETRMRQWLMVALVSTSPDATYLTVIYFGIDNDRRFGEGTLLDILHGENILRKCYASSLRNGVVYIEEIVEDEDEDDPVDQINTFARQGVFRDGAAILKRRNRMLFIDDARKNAVAGCSPGSMNPSSSDLVGSGKSNDAENDQRTKAFNIVTAKPVTASALPAKAWGYHSRLHDRQERIDHLGRVSKQSSACKVSFSQTDDVASVRNGCDISALSRGAIEKWRGRSWLPIRNRSACDPPLWADHKSH